MNQEFVYKKVILVDDDDINNFVNARVLKDFKVSQEVMSFTNGPDCLHYLNEVTSADSIPDLALIDINMPGMDGFELVEKIKELQKEIQQKMKILMLTSSHDERDMEKTKKMGITEYIIKPLTDENINKLVS